MIDLRLNLVWSIRECRHASIRQRQTGFDRIDDPRGFGDRVLAGEDDIVDNLTDVVAVGGNFGGCDTDRGEQPMTEPMDCRHGHRIKFGERAS